METIIYKLIAWEIRIQNEGTRSIVRVDIEKELISTWRAEPQANYRRKSQINI